MNVAGIGGQGYGVQRCLDEHDLACCGQSVAHPCLIPSLNAESTKAGEKEICSRTCAVVGSEIKSKEKYRAIIIELAQTQLLNAINDSSIENMALALEYVNVDTLDAALKLDLRIIPPGPVFYTWVARHGTSVFDTVNNPVGFPGLNYVANIKENANRLARKEIPVIVVFSEREMPYSQVLRMKKSFSDNDNIVVLSAEKNLQSCLDLLSNTSRKTKNVFGLLDSLRVVVINDIKNVVRVALDVAEKENKVVAKVGLMKEVKSIHYTDMDNKFLEQSPDYVISQNGLLSFPCFSRYFAFNFLTKESLERFSASERQRIMKHASYFDGHPYIKYRHSDATWSNDKILTSFWYIFSGKASLEFIELRKISRGVEYDKYGKQGVDIWSGDNGLISVKYDAMDIFKARVKTEDTNIDFFKKTTESAPDDHDSLYSTAHSLVGIQLWRTFLGGHDYSWT